MHKLLLTILSLAIFLMAGSAGAFDLEDSLREAFTPQASQVRPDIVTTQGGGMTLDQAVESVRRRGDVERILSAETKRNGDREVHHIRYLTKNGTVKTAKIPGKSGK